MVVTADGRVIATVAISGGGDATVPVLFDDRLELTIVREAADDPVATGVLSCPARAGPAGPLAASLMVVAVVATAAAVLPRPAAPRIG